MRGVFVTGTDTNVGKTIVSALIAQAAHLQTSAAYYKPIQAGGLELTDRDVVDSLTAAEVRCEPSTYQLLQAASPNRAARCEGIEISLSEILRATKSFSDRFYIVEGAGGLMVPVNSTEKIADVIAALDLPAVVVASTRLGTINHTVLTWQSLKMRGLKPVALVLVGEKDPGLDEVLREQLDIPLLIEIPQFPAITAEVIARVAAEHPGLRSLVTNLLQAGEPSSEIIAKDRQYVWHPFTQHKFDEDFPEIVAGRGSYVKTAQGQWLFDGISSWWVNNLGHGQPLIAQSLAEQAHTLEHVLFAGFTHRPGVELVEKLVRLARERGCSLQRGFYSDNGSTSVEVALKMAFQFHVNRGQKNRNRFIALTNSYHGDTLGAMSVGGRGGYFVPFEPLLFKVDAVDPTKPQQLCDLLESAPDSYAAIILEPMVQGAGGMRMYGPEFLDHVQAVCQKHQVLTIADEVFTGFWRTGKMFAFEHSQWRPDFICLSKGLTGGFLPLSLTLTREEIFAAFAGEDMHSAFLHGHSYTANPIACRAALATLSLLETERVQERIYRLCEQTRHSISELSERSWCRQARALGVIGAFEFKVDDGYFASDFVRRFAAKALAKDLLLRPLGSTVYVCPPYSTEPQELAEVYSKIKEIMDNWE